MIEKKIKHSEANQKIEKYIRKYLNNAPLSFIYKTFRKKDIKVNDHWVDKSYILKDDDIVKIYISDDQLQEFNEPKKIENIKLDRIDIVYEDNNILVVNKPKGILIHGDITEKRKTLSNSVLSYLYNKGEYNDKEDCYVPSPVHRLDRNTSGLVIFAKNIISSQELMELFKEHKNIEKHYLVLVNGKTPINGRIDAPLIKNSKEGLVKVDFDSKLAKEAITEYRVISQNDNYSLLDVNLLTGRTHQIRAHFLYLGFPLIGDPKYGNFKINKAFKEKYKMEHQFLHAYKIKFKNIDGDLSYLSNKEFKIDLNNKEKNIILDLNLKI